MPSRYKDAKIPDRSARALITCSVLDPSIAYNGLNGNLRARGIGYNASEWMKKVGYFPGVPTTEFFEDLAAISTVLLLKVVGLAKDHPDALNLDDLQELSLTADGRRLLNVTQVRVYTEAPWSTRWKDALGWQNWEEIEVGRRVVGREQAADEELVLLRLDMKRRGLRLRDVAEKIGCKVRLLSQVLTGKKSSRWLEFARNYISSVDALPIGGTGMGSIFGDCQTNGDYAIAYRRLGWSVVPFCISADGRKMPRIKWKPFQTRLPTEQEIRTWWGQHPDDLIALVLGPISGVLGVDSDSIEAQNVYLDQLGEFPIAPSVQSGSQKPGRFHQLFRHPSLLTKAKATPWHPELEFRGAGGVLILCPSLHPSGKEYAWFKGHSLEEVSLPEVPDKILESLRAIDVPSKGPSPAPNPLQVISADLNALLTPALRKLLKSAQVGQRNDTLFRSACQLKAKDTALETARKLLRPFFQNLGLNAKEIEDTIRSAYAQKRGLAYR